MDSNTLIAILGGAAVVGGLFYFMNRGRKEPEQPKQEQPKPGSQGLQLQAYERLTLLTDRISLPNLISRISSNGLSATEMQFVLARHIRDEFDHNITQQIYVSADAWTAVKNLKEKNLLIINRVGAGLPATATGMELNRAILELLLNDPKADIAGLVSEAISYEARKLL
jgi:hypothetical protein